MKEQRLVIAEAREKLLPLIGNRQLKTGLILGSGLGDYAETLENPRFLSYGDIDGFPVSHVFGHKSRFVVGEKYGKTVIVMQGRFHYYEGYSPAELAIGIRVMKAVGVEQVLLTNAAGGVNAAFHPGTLMAITDHINFARVNPLIGPNDDSLGPRFPDQSHVYDRELLKGLKDTAEALRIPLAEGVYMMFTGPTFETPAEIRMARAMGADAVGMSTVPEAIAASHCGIRVMGITLVTNMAAGMLDQPLTHQEVTETANAAAKEFTRLVDGLIERVF